MPDVVIVGGGPAGLNAALVLGRCRREVVVLDDGHPRNARSRGVRGYLTRDGTDPAALRELGRRELAAYPNVKLMDDEVVVAARRDDGFEVACRGGRRIQARKLLLATGWRDDAPTFPDAGRFYGRGVYPCPYCDGWEHRDERLLVYGREHAGAGLALELTTWSSDIVLLTDGRSALLPHDRERLDRHGIGTVEAHIARLEGDPEREGLERAVFEDGSAIESRAIFFPFAKGRQSALFSGLGLEGRRLVETGPHEQTAVPGLFVAGDAIRSVQFAIVAAGEGATAGYAINTELLKEDLARAEHRSRAPGTRA